MPLFISMMRLLLNKRVRFQGGIPSIRVINSRKVIVVQLVTYYPLQRNKPLQVLALEEISVFGIVIHIS